MNEEIEINVILLDQNGRPIIGDVQHLLEMRSVVDNSILIVRYVVIFF